MLLAFLLFLYFADVLELQQDTSIDDAGLNEISEKSNNQFKFGLNPSFVDQDIDLDVPEGIEGPEHVYVKPPESINLKD